MRDIRHAVDRYLPSRMLISSIPLDNSLASEARVRDVTSV